MMFREFLHALSFGMFKAKPVQPTPVQEAEAAIQEHKRMYLTQKSESIKANKMAEYHHDSIQLLKSFKAQESI